MAAKKYGCPVEFTLDRIGGKWKCVILWWLRRGSKRFSELIQLMPDISPKVLTAQLRELEADALIERETFAESPPRVQYSLTAFGDTLRPITQLMCDWGKFHAPEYQFGLECLRGLKILAIGNEIFKQRMEGELGELRGADVMATSEAIAQLDLSDLKQTNPDIIVIDFEANANFEDINKLIDQFESSVPLIALTKTGSPIIQASARELDRRYRIHLAEPVDISELVGAIANLTNRDQSRSFLEPI